MGRGEEVNSKTKTGISKTQIQKLRRECENCMYGYMQTCKRMRCGWAQLGENMQSVHVFVSFTNCMRFIGHAVAHETCLRSSYMCTGVVSEGKHGLCLSYQGRSHMKKGRLLGLTHGG